MTSPATIAIVAADDPPPEPPVPVVGEAGCPATET